jgi:hypothetical protein
MKKREPTMNVINRLATSLNRRDEVPNKELAIEIVRTNDKRAVKEIVENLGHKDQNIQSDCIKVLYEIGEREPALIANYYREFGKLLDSANNRLIWGAMTALDSIAANEPKGVYSLLEKILDAADSGSVITRDHAVGILIKLGTLKRYQDECVPLLIEQLLSCPNNQFPMYAEMSLAVVNDGNKEALRKVMTRRLDGLEKESQKKRIAKVLKRLTKKTG